MLSARGLGEGLFSQICVWKRRRGRRPGETVYQCAIVAAFAPLRMQQIDTPMWKLEILQQRCCNGVPPVVETAKLSSQLAACLSHLLARLCWQSPACLTQTNSIFVIRLVWPFFKTVCIACCFCCSHFTLFSFDMSH